MKVVATTDEYTIYRRRDERFAVKNAEREWVNGDAKVAILLEHELIDVPAPVRQDEPVEAAADDAAVAAEAPEDAGSGDAPAEDAAAKDAAAKDPAKNDAEPES